MSPAPASILGIPFTPALAAEIAALDGPPTDAASTEARELWKEMLAGHPAFPAARCWAVLQAFVARSAEPSRPSAPAGQEPREWWMWTAEECARKNLQHAAKVGARP